MVNVHPELIGSIDSVEPFHGSVDKVIAQFRASTGPEMLDNGILLEHCAMHFYGLLPHEFDTTEELIGAMVSIGKET